MSFSTKLSASTFLTKLHVPIRLCRGKLKTYTNVHLVCKCKYLQQYMLFYSSFCFKTFRFVLLPPNFSSQVPMILQRQLRQAKKKKQKHSHYQLLTPTRFFSSRCFLFFSISAFSISISVCNYKYSTFNSTNNRKR